jgi:hypothetical protein
VIIGSFAESAKNFGTASDSLLEDESPSMVLRIEKGGKILGELIDFLNLFPGPKECDDYNVLLSLNLDIPLLPLQKIAEMTNITKTLIHEGTAMQVYHPAWRKLPIFADYIGMEEKLDEYEVDEAFFSATRKWGW